MAAELRILRESDAPALKAFLEQRSDSSLILLANSESAGIEDQGQFRQGCYAAQFVEGHITAVAAHYWNGNLIVQGELGLEAAAALAVRESGRELCGLLGPRVLTERVRVALDLQARSTATDSADILFALDLSQLRAPQLLDSERVSIRGPEPSLRETLVAWRIAYEVEALGAEATEALERRIRESFDQWPPGSTFALMFDEVPVATASLPVKTRTAVQVGGVFTPRPLRGRGYGRAVVAAALIEARNHGATRSVLFTNIENAAAIRAYTSLGYEPVSEWGLILFRCPIDF